MAYTNLGTILDVTPRISANDYIWLTVTPEVSSDFGTVTRIVAGVTLLPTRPKVLEQLLSSMPMA